MRQTQVWEFWAGHVMFRIVAPTLVDACMIFDRLRGDDPEVDRIDRIGSAYES